MNEFKKNLKKLEQLHKLKVACLLKESQRLDQQMIEDLAASHLQTTKEFNHGDWEIKIKFNR